MVNIKTLQVTRELTHVVTQLNICLARRKKGIKKGSNIAENLVCNNNASVYNLFEI